MIRNIVGAAVTAGDFYGREKEIRQGLNKLKNGNSLMLSAPRRVGKTSFSKKMIELLEEEGWVGIFIDMEHLNTEVGLYKELARKINEKLDAFPRLANNVKQALGNLSVCFNNFELKTGGDIDARQSLRNDILKVINNKKDPIKLLFVFDELAVFLNNITSDESHLENARNFLNWLRSVRQECQGQALWIFCSSISIENYLMVHKLSASMNDTMEFELGAMPENEALGLLDELSEGADISIPKTVQKYILNKLGLPLPYNIQGLFSEIVDNVNPKAKITRNDVDSAYHQLLTNSPHMKTWYERLSDYKAHEQDLKMILRYICRQPGPVSEEELFNTVLICHEDEDEERLRVLIRILIHDGYILPDQEGRLAFRMNLLKDYWKYHSL